MSLIADYEQQYAVLTAETTAEIGKLDRSNSEDKRLIVTKITANLEEIHELLEQIGLEIREADAAHRPSLNNRLQCYQAELKRLKDEFHRASNNKRNETAVTLYDSSDYDNSRSVHDDQQTRLLDNSERIERSGNRLADGYRTILETESIGASVLADLSQQRETLQRSRNRLRETNEDIRQANKSMNSMIMRSLREKGLLYGIGLVFVIVVSLSIYFSLSK